MLLNQNTAPVITGANPELQSVLSAYFNSHSAVETSESTAELLQAYINPSAEYDNNTVEIANMVFFAFNLNALITKVAALDFTGSLGITETSPERLQILSFFDSFGFDYPVEFLSDALQAWICPDADTQRHKKNLADAVCLVVEINKLVLTLEAINNQFQEGGLQCA